MSKKLHEIYPLIQDKQWQFMNDPHKFRLYGGAKGGGKSHAMRMECVKQCLSAKNVRGIALRRTNKEIEENMVTPMLGELPPSMYTYNATDNIVTFKNGSTLRFSYCRNKKDVQQYQGIEYDFICIEELTHWTEAEFKIIRTCLRSARKGITPNFFASTNPGGVGHTWVRRIWVNRDFKGREKPNDYSFIPATVYDNKILLDSNPDYLELLEDLDEIQRRAFLLGDWDAFEGQYFTEFNRDLHVIDPFVPLVGVKRRIVHGDFGSAAPSAIYWSALMNDGRMITYRELYEPFLYESLADAICDNTTEEEWGELVVFAVDPSICGKKSEDTGNTGADVLDKRFIERDSNLRTYPANNNRLDGWRSTKAWMHPRKDKDGKEYSLWVVTSNCRNLIRTIPEQMHDERNVEDMDTTLEDHPSDGLRYGIMEFNVEPVSLAEVEDIQKEAQRRSKKQSEDEEFEDDDDVLNLHGEDSDNVLTEAW